MKRKLELLRSTGVVLMDLYQVEGTKRLLLLITDFGHDYRNSFWEIRPAHRSAIRAHAGEKEFAEEVCRLRSTYAVEVPSARLSYDAATKRYWVSDSEPDRAAQVP